MQRIITEEQIPTGDFRAVEYVGAIKGRSEDAGSVTVWGSPQAAPPAPIPGVPVAEWKDVLISVDDPDAPETIKRLHEAVLSRRRQQQID